MHHMYLSPTSLTYRAIYRGHGSYLILRHMHGFRILRDNIHLKNCHFLWDSKPISSLLPIWDSHPPWDPPLLGFKPRSFKYGCVLPNSYSKWASQIGTKQSRVFFPTMWLDKNIMSLYSTIIRWSHSPTLIIKNHVPYKAYWFMTKL